jgi:LmeA-like phospholipid-binding
MSYEPTQPMTPPSTSLTDQASEDPGSDSQADAGQDDAGQDDAARATAPKSDSGLDPAPAGGVSQATVPRAVLSQASVPAPPGNAPQSGWGQGSRPQGDWTPADEPQADAGQGNAQQGYAPQGDWGQGNAPQGDWGQGNGPQGHGPQGDWGQGNGPQGDWNQGNRPQGYGPAGYGPEDGPQPRPRRRRRRPVRRSAIALFVLLVLAIVFVIANFVGQAIAENDMANQFTANGFPVKPSVDIEGFPFLTQVEQKDFKKVVISASNIPAGPVTISSLNATITGMHLNSSWNGATIDHVTATAFVSLSSLTDGISSELGDAASLTAVPDGANKLKVTGTVLGASASGVVEIKQTGPQRITVGLPTSGGLVGTLLGSAASFTITLPAGVPPSLRITGLTLNGQGLTLSAAATNAVFSK